MSDLALDEALAIIAKCGKQFWRTKQQERLLAEAWEVVDLYSTKALWRAAARDHSQGGEGQDGSSNDGAR